MKHGGDRSSGQKQGRMPRRDFVNFTVTIFNNNPPGRPGIKEELNMIRLMIAIIFIGSIYTHRVEPEQLTGFMTGGITFLGMMCIVCGWGDLYDYESRWSPERCMCSILVGALLTIGGIVVMCNVA